MTFDRREYMESVDRAVKEVLADAEQAIPGCACGAGDLCVSVELKALIEGTLTEEQRKDIAVAWATLIIERGRREDAKAQFLAALDEATQPIRDAEGIVDFPPLIYNGPKKGTDH